MNKTVKKFSIQELCFIKPPKVYGLRFVDYSDYAALEAELARVRAESLRVVPVGEAEPASNFSTGVRCVMDGYSGVYRRCGFGQGGLTAIMEPVHYGEDVRVPRNKMIQPVRLERWEDE